MQDVAAALTGAKGATLDDTRAADLFAKLTQSAQADGLTTEQVVLAFRTTWAREVERVAGVYERIASEENRHRAIETIVPEYFAPRAE
jgi:hypothetical protein